MQELMQLVMAELRKNYGEPYGPHQEYVHYGPDKEYAWPIDYQAAKTRQLWIDDGKKMHDCIRGWT
jgi:hypothetical protein